MNAAFLGAFIVLQAADIWTTLRALKIGKKEINPFLARLFLRFDPFMVMVVIKLAGVLVLWSLDAHFITAACCAVYVWVVVSNWREISRE